jgi:hypothetical protein
MAIVSDLKLAVIVHEVVDEIVKSTLLLVEPLANRTIRREPLGDFPDIEVFPEMDCAVVTCRSPDPKADSTADWLELYRLSDWRLRARRPMDCRAHFNTTPSWSTFLAAPDGRSIYIYKSRALGDHLAEDYFCALNTESGDFSDWNFRVPECVAGLSACAGAAHAQMLFISDGLEYGRLPESGLEQKVAFWLGPDGGMGPSVPIGERPKVHNQLGHARAILFSRRPEMTVVVCTDGVIHLIDPVGFRYLERLSLSFMAGYGMPIFAAQLDPEGSRLYVGASRESQRQAGTVERILVFDVIKKRLLADWALDEPLRQIKLSRDGRYLCGASAARQQLWVLDSFTARTLAVMDVEGDPEYVVPYLESI